MASPNDNGHSKKFTSPHSPGSAVRQIPSSFDSPAIHAGQYVVEGAAQRISNTRIPFGPAEPKPKERKPLKRHSDQPTVMLMATPDLQDEKTKVSLKNWKFVFYNRTSFVCRKT